MRTAHLVIDVDNRLVWSRRVCSSTPVGPNPSESVKNPTIQACVRFFEGSYLPVIEEKDEDCSDDDDDSFVPLPSQDDENSAAIPEVDVPSFSQSVDESATSVVRPCCESVVSEVSSSVEPPSTQTVSPAAVALVVSEVSYCDGDQ